MTYASSTSCIALMLFVTGCAGGATGAADASADTSESVQALTLDCAGPAANPVGRLAFPRCQLGMVGDAPEIICNREPTDLGSGSIHLALVDASALRVGDVVPLTSSALKLSGSFTTSAITANSVDGQTAGNVVFSILDLASPLRVDGVFTPGASLRFRPDPSYECALGGGFTASGS